MGYTLCFADFIIIWYISLCTYHKHAYIHRIYFHAQALNAYAKDHEFYKFKAGIMDQKVVSDKEIKKLANLPSKETLYSMLASALLGNIRNLAVVLNQAKEKQEAEA